MKKKYQVFISSTSKDLKFFRNRLQTLLLSLGCFPAIMEHFPSLGLEILDTIYHMIDQTDYFILVLGDRYGECPREGEGHQGESYVYKEYLYAKKNRMPILPFIYNGSNNTQTINEPEWKTKRLKKFRDEISKLECQFWTNENELIVESLFNIPKIPHKFSSYITKVKKIRY